jgi:alkylation response protein AidB-like acyl-CoA dehydrogenase
VEFELGEDQQELRRTVRGFLDRHATAATVRAAAENDGGFAAGVWERLVGEMELTALAIDVQHGGAGATFVEVGIALEELGRTLLPVPYLSTVVAAGAIAQQPLGTEVASLLERIAGGAIATIRVAGDGMRASTAGAEIAIDGVIEHVPDGVHAELLVLDATVEDEPALCAVGLNGPGVEVKPLPTLDQTRPQAMVHLEGARGVILSAPGEGRQAVDRARDLIAVAHAVESIGAGARCLEQTVSYLQERVQFGRPIGSFQALKHRCADLFSALDSARSTAYYAAWAVDGAPEELPILAPLAQLVCGEALLRIAAEAIQLHGGIGFTWEHDAHLFFKRAKTTELLCGGQRRLRALVGARAGIVR